MKTNEQLESAVELIRQAQDYIELAKVEKKLKGEGNIKAVSKQLDVLTSAISINVENL